MMRFGRLSLRKGCLCLIVNGAVGVHAVMADQNGPSPSATASDTLETITVTAQKISERLIDVPASISAIDADTLLSEHITSLSDLANYVPGMAIQNGGTPGQRTIILQGLSTGYLPAANAPLVATYVDDIPVGPSSGNRGAQLGIDLMPYDLERVEVLRGPQGTLYGSDAMGGIVKFVLKKPDLANLNAEVGAESQYTDGASGANWIGHVAANIPVVAESLAVRLSGNVVHDAGYTSNVGPLGSPNDNHSTTSALRAAALWKASDTFDLQGSFFMQKIEAADRTAVTLDAATQQPVYGRYSWFSNFTEPFDQTSKLAALDLNWDLTFAKLTSSSSWSSLDSVQKRTDLTPLFLGVLPAYPDALSYSYVDDSSWSITEEARLTSNSKSPLHWLFGLYWTLQAPNEFYSLPTLTPNYQPLPYNLYLQTNQDFHYTEQALFGQLTYDLAENVDLSAGYRYNRSKQWGCGELSGVFVTPSAYSCSWLPFQGKGTWLADSRYHFAPDQMVYVRAATGFRPGGGCSTCGNAALEVPNYYYSDSITDYEVGVKGEFLSRTLLLDFAAFYIDWKDIQLTVVSPKGGAYPGNGGSAVSKGFDFTAHYAATRNLTLTATLAYTNAYLTQDAPGISGMKGNELPQTPLWTASVVGQYQRPVTANVSLIAGGSYTYKDSIVNQLAGTGEPLPIGPQNIVNLYCGVATGSVTVRLYGNNVGNDYAFAGLLLLTYANRPSFTPIQPRTVGLSVDYAIGAR